MHAGPERLGVPCAEPAPWWVYLINGLAGLVYLHLDCIDGKQARRTGSSSPLGQLFDHGAATLPVAAAPPLLSSLGAHVCAWVVCWWAQHKAVQILRFTCIAYSQAATR